MPFDSSAKTNGTLVAGIIGTENIDPLDLPELRDRAIGFALDRMKFDVGSLAPYQTLSPNLANPYSLHWA